MIHDVHDMQSLRRTPYEDGYPEPEDPIGLERRAAQEAAAVVTVSPELVAELAARYRLPQRVLAYANYALRRDLPAELPPPRPLDGPPRLVYQGTLSTNGGHYDLRDLFAAIAAQGISLDVYPAREVPEYRSIPGIRVHETLPLAELLQRADALRLRLGRLQHRPQPRAPGHRAAEQALRVPRLRPAGDHAAPPGAAPDAARRGRRDRARRRARAGGRAGRGGRGGAAAARRGRARALHGRGPDRRIAALYRELAAAGGGGLRPTATAAG